MPYILDKSRPLIAKLCHRVYFQSNQHNQQRFVRPYHCIGGVCRLLSRNRHRFIDANG